MSWEGLLSLLQSAAQEVGEILSRPPESCPRCGKPWTPGPNGELHCTSDGYMWDGKRVGHGQ